jgi:hypothetical protein
MQHGFVQLSSLALLVFDEGKYSCCLKSAELTLAQAYYCNGKHPANLIMKLFYYKQDRDRGLECAPHILGLSASPVRGLNLQEIR